MRQWLFLCLLIRAAVHHLLWMVCQHVSATRGAACAMVTLRLVMHVSASFLGHPVNFQWVVICALIFSWVLWVDLSRRCLWRCLCVLVFHRRWSSNVRGRVAFLVSTSTLTC